MFGRKTNYYGGKDGSDDDDAMNVPSMEPSGTSPSSYYDNWDFGDVPEEQGDTGKSSYAVNTSFVDELDSGERYDVDENDRPKWKMGFRLPKKSSSGAAFSSQDSDRKKSGKGLFGFKSRQKSDAASHESLPEPEPDRRDTSQMSKLDRHLEEDYRDEEDQRTKQQSPKRMFGSFVRQARGTVSSTAGSVHDSEPQYAGNSRQSIISSDNEDRDKDSWIPKFGIGGRKVSQVAEDLLPQSRPSDDRRDSKPRELSGLDRHLLYDYADEEEERQRPKEKSKGKFKFGKRKKSSAAADPPTRPAGVPEYMSKGDDLY